MLCIVRTIIHLEGHNTVKHVLYASKNYIMHYRVGVTTGPGVVPRLPRYGARPAARPGKGLAAPRAAPQTISRSPHT